MFLAYSYKHSKCPTIIDTRTCSDSGADENVSEPGAKGSSWTEEAQESSTGSGSSSEESTEESTGSTDGGKDEATGTHESTS